MNICIVGAGANVRGAERQLRGAGHGVYPVGDYHTFNHLFKSLSPGSWRVMGVDLILFDENVFITNFEEKALWAESAIAYDMIKECKNIQDVPVGVVHLDSMRDDDNRISNRFVAVIASGGRSVVEEVLPSPYLVWGKKYAEDGVNFTLEYHELVIEDLDHNPEIHKNWVAIVNTVIGMSRQARWPYPHKRLSPIDNKKPTR